MPTPCSQVGIKALEKPFHSIYKHQCSYCVAWGPRCTEQSDQQC